MPAGKKIHNPELLKQKTASPDPVIKKTIPLLRLFYFRRMNRKHFLGTIASAGAFLLPSAGMAADTATRRNERIIVPPYLVPGDLIGISCPSGYIPEADVLPAVALLESWGFRVLKGTTVGKRDFTFGGTDEERTTDFQQMLDNQEVKAILCGRGGYGVVRMIDRLNFGTFMRAPKWIIGFSDITVFHNHLNHALHVASVHSKMCNSFPSDWSKADAVQVETILSIKKALTGETMEYKALPDLRNRPGHGEGELVGGNLSILETLAGSVSDLDTKNKILFVEDVGEPLYKIDRMFCNLLRTGKLEHLKGLLVGGFTSMKAETPGDEFGRSVQDIVWEKVKAFDFPVAFGFPVGHQKNNFALKCGIRHRLEVNGESTTLKEIK